MNIMAIESNNTAYMTHVFRSRKVSLRKRIPLFNIEERILEHSPDSLRSIARRQIDSLRRRSKFQPQMRSTYVELINVILLDEIVFKNFNLSKIFNKKSDEENE